MGAVVVFLFSASAGKPTCSAPPDNQVNPLRLFVHSFGTLLLVRPFGSQSTVHYTASVLGRILRRSKTFHFEPPKENRRSVAPTTTMLVGN